MSVRRCLSLVVCVLAAVLSASPGAAAEAPSERTVVVLLFDGWAPALLDEVPAPNLERMRSEGAWTHHMVPAFPTISLVNQVTISTGCWPEHHGIVSNLFIDPERGVYDHSHDADWLIGCEHLHQVAERQNVRSATLGWVGRFSAKRGDLAAAVSAERQWTEYPDDPKRVEQVIRMLQTPGPIRPRLILAYFQGPDRLEHFTGMDSGQTRVAAAASDAHVGKIREAIEALPFRDQVTLIVTTDHGMTPVTYNVNVQKILANHAINARFESSGTTSFLYFTDPAEAERAVPLLSGYTEFDVVRRDAQPPDWHLGTSPRVGDLVISAKPPYFIEDVSRWPWWAQWLGKYGPEFIWARLTLKATHGYPPAVPGMDGIFYAWGAGVAPGRELQEIRAIDVHPTVARLLGIAPGTPVDGQVAVDALASGPGKVAQQRQ